MVRLVGFVLAAILCAALLPSSTFAQVNPSLSEAERGIKTGDADAAGHLSIQELRIRARVTGSTADVTLEMRIGSDSTDAYEARLGLALPSNAVVTGYALNVGEAMIPGQLVEQPKARNVYEDVVRAGIDPGLAEVSAGNRFTTRIFPIDRAHPRRFRLSFVAPFDPARGLVLPLSRDTPIGKLTLDLRVDGHQAAPAVRFAGSAVPLLRDGNAWRGSAETADRPLRDGLVIARAAPVAPILVARHGNGEQFFVIAGAAAASGAAPARGRLRIYWDRSLSHGRDKPEIEAEILARLADHTAPNAIDLVSFASDAPRVTVLRDGADLTQALRRMVYRGGTSLAGLDGLSLPPAAQCVLVFDGQTTIDRAAEFAPDCPLTILTASSAADGPRLDRLAHSAGATVVRADTDTAGAAHRLASTAPRVVSVRDEAGRRLQFRALPADAGSWLLAGRMPDGGALRLRFSDGSERRYDAPSAVLDADAPGALWAAQEVQALGDDPARHKAMVELARRYSVAGPAMSFIVLDSSEQYLQAGIAPPRGFDAEWMERYREAKREADREAGEARSERLAFVVREWKERKAWWSQRFVARRKKRSAPEPLPMPAPEPAPMPVTAAPAPASDAGESDLGNIVVTGSAMRATASRDAAPRPVAETAIKLDLANLVANSPYIAALAAAAPGERLRVLAEQERAYGTLPSFYLDTAEWFRLKGDTSTASLLMLSALELPTSDDETRQILAFRLERDGSHDRAIELAEQLAAANAEFRPQPARDLALALAARGHARGRAGRADLERAFALLTEAALNPASSDFDGFEVIALMEANALIPDIEAAGGTWTLDERLIALLDTDARIVIEWTADDADIDLWVDEPNGERVYYGDKLSSAGGQISNDMTNGYGPEEYAIRRAPAGAYAVRVNGYDADRLNPNGPGHVLIRLIRNFARRGEKDVLVDADLSFQRGSNRNSEDETRPIATLTVGR